MAYTYTWKINDLRRRISDGFVLFASATVTCSKGDGVEKVELQSNYSRNLAEPESLIPFKDLNEEQVIGWIKAEMGSDAVTAFETDLKTQLDAKIEQTGKPW